MNRRELLIMGGLGGIGLFIPWKPKDELVIEKIPCDNFLATFPWRWKFSKGGYSTCWSAGPYDLLDCHGLCSTDELAMCVAKEIEYFGKFGTFNEDGTTQAPSKSQKITRSEYRRIYRIFAAEREPHNCSRAGYKMHDNKNDEPLLFWNFQ